MKGPCYVPKLSLVVGRVGGRPTEMFGELQVGVLRYRRLTMEREGGAPSLPAIRLGTTLLKIVCMSCMTDHFVVE